MQNIFKTFLKIFVKDSQTSSKGKRIVKILLNPMSGAGETKKVMKQINKGIRKYFSHSNVEIIFSRTAGDLSNIAKEWADKNADIVIAAGGDGAVNEVVQGLANSNTALGILPLGTGNVFSHEIGLPQNIEECCKTLSEAQIKTVDLGYCENKYFLWLAGVGIDALVAQEINWELKDSLGVFAYFAFALQHLKKIPYFVTKLNIDGKEIKERAVAVIIGNSATFGGNLKIKSLDSFADGYLDVCIYTKITFMGVVRQVLFFFLGQKTYYKDVGYFNVKYFKAKNISIKTRPKSFVHLDGEVIGKNPVSFSIKEKALKLLVPKEQ